MMTTKSQLMRAAVRTKLRTVKARNIMPASDATLSITLVPQGVAETLLAGDTTLAERRDRQMMRGFFAVLGLDYDQIIGGAT